MSDPAGTRARPAAAAGQIVALCVVILGAMAFAVPPAPIEAEGEGAPLGYLVSYGSFSDQFAEQVARSGYTYLALDLTGARMDEDALWRDHFKRVTSRRFPIWGWVDTRTGIEAVPELIRSLPLAGLFVYGPGAAQAARRLSAERSALRIIPVLRMQDPAEGVDDYALLMRIEDFLDQDVEADLPVLIADQLDPEHIEEARRARPDGCLIAGAPVLDY